MRIFSGEKGKLSNKQVFAIRGQRQLYSDEEIAHFERSQSANKYIRPKVIASGGTVRHYKTKVAAFASFVYKTCGKQKVNACIEEIKRRAA